MDQQTPNSFPSAEAFLAFALAGRATFTATSRATGEHFTYSISECRDDANKFFVSLCTGGDGMRSYMGMLSRGQIARGLIQTKASKVGPDAPSSRAFRWFWWHLMAGRMPAQLVLQHDGRCGVCHRQLTNPRSLATGLGPECEGRVALACEKIAA